MSKRGLPTGIKMRHDAHYVEEIAKANRTVGKMLPVSEVYPNPDQPRNDIGDLDELTASIKEQGVLEPLLVQPKDDGKWMIIAGERRWRASKAAELDEIPCVILDIDDKTVAEIALVENLQRKDLTVWEVADGLKDLADRFSYTHDQIAQKIGKSRTSVTESLSIASLPQEVRKRCQENSIEAKSTLVEISREFDEKAMHSLLDRVLEGDGDVAREDVRESKKGSSPSSSAKKRSKATEANENLFTYKSTENGFTLKIKHNSDTEVTRTDLLRALKEVFDSVKAGG